MTATIEDLSYDRNIPRDIVHRESIAEVFLTDARPAARGAVFAAQLPRNHSYSVITGGRQRRTIRCC
ncbi:hypothetical protein GCM10027169_15780 [Gordonia jinhuaensis]|uniref:Uncharacterized protein n=1 Tax=Gordonia jinhuaensis TaxID=1517702 RepID=A0A916TKJ4_9ACTN|nr:hypothetical protein GCM10011489_40020 [Gordonia jinhuaensis]